jgi:hypothetical protein
MGKAMYELREMLSSELDKISHKGELTPSLLDMVDKLTHSIKSIDTICAMEEAYGNDDYDDYSYEGGSSYARGRGRNARRDSMGRYSRAGNSYRYSNRDGYRRGYSRDEGKENARMQLQELMGMATDPNVRMAIQKAMDEMEKE